MKRYIVIFFITSYLFSITPLSELLKVDKLVEHYVEHTTHDAGLTLWGFLSMHYSGKNVKDADHTKDMELPFKTLNTTNIVSISICNPIEDFQFTEITTKKEYKKPNYQYNFLFSSNFHSNIWQPPKIS